MFDPSEFDSTDEHLPDEIDNNELWDELDENVLIMDASETHTSFWNDLSEVNFDDVPF